MSEESHITGTEIQSEVPPNKGINIRAAESSELVEGKIVYLLSKDKGNYVAVKTAYKVQKNSDGKIVLKQADEELPDVEKRKELARAIVEAHMEDIKDQAIIATEQALSRKPVETLEAMADAGKKGAKPKMSSKKGCVSFQLGDQEIIL